MPLKLPQSVVPLIGATAVQRHDGSWFAQGRDLVTGRRTNDDEWFPVKLPKFEPADTLGSQGLRPEDDGMKERLLSVCSNTLLLSNLRACLWARGAWQNIRMQPSEGGDVDQVRCASGCIAMDKVHIAIVIGPSNTLLTTWFPFTPTFPPPRTLPPSSWTSWHHLGPCLSLVSGAAHFAAICTAPLRTTSSLYTWGMNNLGQLGLGTVSVGQDDAWHAMPVVPDALDGLDVKRVHLAKGTSHMAGVVLDACVMTWGGAKKKSRVGPEEEEENDSTIPTMVTEPPPVWVDDGGDSVDVRDEEWAPRHVWTGWDAMVVGMEREMAGEHYGLIAGKDELAFAGYGDLSGVKRIVNAIKQNAG